LEIIGNSKDVTNIQKFFNKMFAGINFVENEEKGVLLTGMRSRENETVTFAKNFKITDYKKINEWLDQLEYQMKASLAAQFEKAIEGWTI
jgi:dynein heavy chain 1